MKFSKKQNKFLALFNRDDRKYIEKWFAEPSKKNFHLLTRTLFRNWTSKIDIMKYYFIMSDDELGNDIGNFKKYFIENINEYLYKGAKNKILVLESIVLQGFLKDNTEPYIWQNFIDNVSKIVTEDINIQYKIVEQVKTTLYSGELILVENFYKFSALHNSEQIKKIFSESKELTKALNQLEKKEHIDENFINSSMFEILLFNNEYKQEVFHYLSFLLRKKSGNIKNILKKKINKILLAFVEPSKQYKLAKLMVNAGYTDMVFANWERWTCFNFNNLSGQNVKFLEAIVNKIIKTDDYYYLVDYFTELGNLQHDFLFQKRLLKKILNENKLNLFFKLVNKFNFIANNLVLDLIKEHKDKFESVKDRFFNKSWENRFPEFVSLLSDRSWSVEKSLYYNNIHQIIDECIRQNDLEELEYIWQKAVKDKYIDKIDYYIFKKLIRYNIVGFVKMYRKSFKVKDINKQFELAKLILASKHVSEFMEMFESDFNITEENQEFELAKIMLKNAYIDEFIQMFKFNFDIESKQNQLKLVDFMLKNFYTKQCFENFSIFNNIDIDDQKNIIEEIKDSKNSFSILLKNIHEFTLFKEDEEYTFKFIMWAMENNYIENVLKYFNEYLVMTDDKMKDKIVRYLLNNEYFQFLFKYLDKFLLLSSDIYQFKLLKYLVKKEYVIEVLNNLTKFTKLQTREYQFQIFQIIKDNHDLLLLYENMNVFDKFTNEEQKKLKIILENEFHFGVEQYIEKELVQATSKTELENKKFLKIQKNPNWNRALQKENEKKYFKKIEKKEKEESQFSNNLFSEQSRIL